MKPTTPKPLSIYDFRRPFLSTKPRDDIKVITRFNITKPANATGDQDYEYYYEYYYDYVYPDEIEQGLEKDEDVVEILPRPSYLKRSNEVKKMKVTSKTEIIDSDKSKLKVRKKKRKRKKKTD